jgi:flagellar biosynthetic protein FliR
MIPMLNIVVFWLLASRLTGFFILAPGVQDLEVPKLVRVAVIVWLACFMTPLVGHAVAVDLSWPSLLAGVVMEFLFGLGLGLVTRLVLTALQVGGSLMDNDLSLSAAQQLNPSAGISGGVGVRLSLRVARRHPTIVSGAASRRRRSDPPLAGLDGPAVRRTF